MRLTPFNPEPGKVYTMMTGALVECIELTEPYQHNAVMANKLSGWTIEAHHIYLREDGRIEWDWSTKGYFQEDKKND